MQTHTALQHCRFEISYDQTDVLQHDLVVAVPEVQLKVRATVPPPLRALQPRHRAGAARARAPTQHRCALTVLQLFSQLLFCPRSQRLRLIVAKSAHALLLSYHGMQLHNAAAGSDAGVPTFMSIYDVREWSDAAPRAAPA